MILQEFNADVVLYNLMARVQCDVPAVTNISLDNDDNENHKLYLMSMLNVLFLKQITCTVLVS